MQSSPLLWLCFSGDLLCLWKEEVGGGVTICCQGLHENTLKHQSSLSASLFKIITVFLFELKLFNSFV